MSPGFEVIGPEELKKVVSVFSSGGVLFRRGFDQLRGNSYAVKDFEAAFAKKMHVDYALAVSSGTAALRVALASYGIGNGDEVITQSFTFVATVEAIIESGAMPVCINIDETLNLDPNELEKSITPRTKAIIVVHMLGTPARLPEIKRICERHNLILIEDTAWGCGGALLGRPLGTWGDIGTYSFDYAKTITTGEGGMLVFKDKDAYERASAWHDHGHENNPHVPRWEDTRSSSGFNYRMMELQGAVGLAQIDKLDQIVQAQRANASAIKNAIANFDEIVFRSSPPGSFESADALIFLVPTNQIALNCRKELLKLGLSTKILPEAYTWHFAGCWNHMPSLMESHSSDLASAFKKSHDILSKAVALPISVNMDKGHPSLVKQAISNALSL